MNKLINSLSKKLVKFYFSFGDIDRKVLYYLLASSAMFFIWQIILVYYNEWPFMKSLFISDSVNDIKPVILKFFEFSFFMFIGNCLYFINASKKNNGIFNDCSKEDPFLKIELLTEMLNARSALLKKSDEKFRKLIEYNSDAIILVDSSGVIQYVNVAMMNLTVISREKLIGIQFGFPLTDGEISDIDIVRADNEIKQAEMRVSEIDFNGNTCYIVSIRDFTDKYKPCSADKSIKSSINYNNYISD